MLKIRNYSSRSLRMRDRPMVSCEYHDNLNPFVVLLFISTCAFFKVHMKTFSSFSLASLLNINIVFHH